MSLLSNTKTIELLFWRKNGRRPQSFSFVDNKLINNSHINLYQKSSNLHGSQITYFIIIIVDLNTNINVLL